MTIKDDAQIIKKLLCFVETCKNGKIKEAAAKNGLKQSNLSSLLKELEIELGIPLLNRLQKGISLTDTGRDILGLAVQFYTLLYKIRNYASVSQRNGGEVRLWLGDGLASGYISSCLGEFSLRYPNISLNLNCNIDAPQLIDETDIAIVYEQPQQNDAVIITKHKLHFGLFASREYIEKHGEPQNIEDLCKNHQICTRANFPSVWPKWCDITNKAKKISVQTNSAPVLVQVIKDGLGVGLLPCIGYKKDLVEISKIDLKISHPFWIVSHRASKDIPHIRTLINYIIESTKNL